MFTLISSEKLPGGSLKEVVRETRTITITMHQGKPVSIYHEQEIVTYIDGDPMKKEGVEAESIGPSDVITDDQLVVVEAVKTILDDRVAVNDANRVTTAKAIADAQIAQRADAILLAEPMDKV